MKASDNPFPSLLVVETAAASIGTPSAGDQHLFIDTDHVLKYKNSSAVVTDVGSGGGGGAMEQISDTILGSPAANIDLTSISGSFNHLRLACKLRVTQSTTFDWIFMRLNNDSGANYYGNGYYIQNATFLATGPDNSQTKGRIGPCVGASGTASHAMGLTIDIQDYARTAWIKTVTMNWSLYGSTSTTLMTGQSMFFWDNTAAITRLTFLPTSNNFDTGSRVTLYGVT